MALSPISILLQELQNTIHCEHSMDEDSFTFKVHDGKDKSLPAFVNITVIDDNINDGPCCRV